MSIRLLTYLLVGVGSGIGASVRLLISLWLHQPSVLWPWSTLWVNALGCFFVGYYAFQVSPFNGDKPAWRVSNVQKQFVLAGIFGGFTTLSVFSLEWLQLVIAGSWWFAMFFLLSSVFSWLVAIWLGSWLARYSRIG